MLLMVNRYYSQNVELKVAKLGQKIVAKFKKKTHYIDKIL